MREFIVVLIIAMLCSCAQISETPALACDIYAKISTINLDEMSPEKLREWVKMNYPDAIFEDDSVHSVYENSYVWEEDSLYYYANYREGRLLHIKIFAIADKSNALGSPKEVIGCFGEPTHYSATLVPPLIYFSLLYPSHGASFGGGLTEMPNTSNFESSVISSVTISRPTTDMQQVARDVSPSGDSTYVEFIHPWVSWHNIEIDEGWETSGD